MPQTFYKRTGPVSNPSSIDTTSLNGKTAFVTGGSSGLGLCYVKAFEDAGCFVVNADLKPPSDILDSSRVVFVKCDVTVWLDQAAAFETAARLSPNKKIDIVVANAGIAGPDILTGLDDEVPQPPFTRMIDINVVGVMYTTKLAGWYFRRHHVDPSQGCLILISSIMGYIDTQSSAIYAASKFAVRGMMCCLRRKGVFRVNLIAPWVIETPIMKKDSLDTVRLQFQNMGLDVAFKEDAVRAVLRIATDPIMNGHALAIVPPQLAPSGYLDLDLDDLPENIPADMLQKAASAMDYSKFGHAIS